MGNTLKKLVILCGILLCSIAAWAQALPYVPPAVAVYVSPTGAVGTWKPATVGSGTAIPSVPSMAIGLYGSSDGTGNVGTWAPTNVFTAGAGTIPQAPSPAAAYVSTTGAVGTWKPLTGTTGTALPYAPSSIAAYCSSDGTGNVGTWSPCGLTGGSTGLPYGPTPVALYCSLDGTGNAGTWAPCAASVVPVTIIHTVFNEGAAFTPLTGTSPATNVHGNLWVIWPSQPSMEFISGGGAQAVGATQGSIINTGASSYTVTFSGMTNTANAFIAFSATASMNDRMQLSTIGASGIALVEVVAGTATTLQTQPVAAGTTGTIVAVVNGQSITVTAFGQAPMTYTIPAGHADIGGPFIGMLANSGIGMGGINVTVP